MNRMIGYGKVKPIFTQRRLTADRNKIEQKQTETILPSLDVDASLSFVAIDTIVYHNQLGYGNIPNIPTTPSDDV